MKLSKKNLIFFKVLTPIWVVYLAYFAFLKFVIYPSYEIATVKTVLKARYSLTQIPKEVDYLILGDSSGMYAINPIAFSTNSYSAANQGYSLFLSYALLDKLKNIKIAKGIILTQTFIPAHYDDDFWQYLIPADEINYGQILEIQCSDKVQTCSLPQKIELMVKYASSRLQLTKHSLISFKNSFSLMIHAQNTENRITDFKNRIHTNNGFYSSPNSKTEEDHLFYKPYFDYFEDTIPFPPKSELEALKKLTDMAKSQHIDVFFVQVPLYGGVPYYDTTQYEKQVAQILSSFQFENFKIIKNDLRRLNLKKSDYYDFNHLTSSGAKKFSTYLAEIIKK